MKIFKNKYVRVATFGVLTILGIFVVLFILSFTATSRHGGYGMMQTNSVSEMPFIMDSMMEEVGKIGIGEGATMPMYDNVSPPELQIYNYPQPISGGYTTNLEQYETTDYNVYARTRSFDDLCAVVTGLKSDPDIHFKSINTSLNSCDAHFYVSEQKAASVLATLSANDDVEVHRETRSVTRHKQYIESRTSSLVQQLANVERSLATVETQFDEITAFARTQNDAMAFAESIREKVNLIDSLTQRKISLTNQLDQLYQQAADLAERIDVVAFSVAINRSHPIEQNRWSRQWEAAWENLKDEANATLIGITVFFGIFLLWVVRIALYAFVLIALVRILWKFGTTLWKK